MRRASPPDMRRNGAAALATAAAAAAMWCFMQPPSVTIDGERRECHGGTTLYNQLIVGGGQDGQGWAPAGCEAAADRRLWYGGGLALLAGAATTGAVFSGREREPAG